MTRRRPTPPVTLPPFTWETDGATGTPDASGRPGRAALARPALERATVKDGGEIGPDGTVRPFRVQVWRRKAPAILRALPEHQREALAVYADAIHRAGASGGTLDPSGGGGGGTPGPNLARLIAAETVARVHAALGNRGVRVRRSGPTLSFRDLVDGLAISGLTATELARKIEPGSPGQRPSRPALAVVAEGAGIAAESVALALGLTVRPN